MVEQNQRIYIPSTDDCDELASMFARAFQYYPFYTHSLPDEATRLKKMESLFKILVRFAMKYGGLYASSQDLEGALICLDPTKGKINAWRMLTCGAAAIPFRVGLKFIKLQAPIGKTIREMYERNAKYPHAYVWLLGVDPAHQGNGHAGRLLAHVTKQMDEGKMFGYLETAKEINTKIYRKYGFSVVEHVSLEKIGMELWSMTREPRLIK
ncbi:MAG: GNAT family N-acetyltransferase [Promethearchaeota archaeon]